MIRRSIASAILAVSLGVGLCGSFAACDGSDARVGVDEPMHVKSAQFIEGALPGTQPGTPGPDDLKVTSISSNNRVVLPGQAGKKFEGRASQRATGIGVRFADVGTGYWVFPLGAPDPQFPGELSWGADVDFSTIVTQTPGFHPLRVVAIDANGVAGEQDEVSLCVASAIPDNLNSCDPKIAPPDVVVSLVWDAPMDVDLRVTLPGGRTVDPKHPLTDPTADGGAANPDIGVVDRDSLASCVEDGRRRENLVWQKRPQGTIDLYAQLFSACGRQATSFSYVIYEAEGEVPNRKLVEKKRFDGRLANTLSGNESEQPPLYVASYTF
ncbi:hypothetical protein AKJ09_08093 [Labilithrix luteola]|uniref:Lipoprotein n=1 Tax=Labilithrix luteola TaxID=1391654 RepID=A0A0K1Q7P3_9BACT|nr:hypothetical protein [Labilithrix luteola]AKV01430.1 hypothetical protein AKJ09_08093 [Labilithrix luteola]